MHSTHKTIAIVGGGITGLTAAFQVQTQMPTARVVLLESSDRLGGVLQTLSVDGYLVEQSADMFTSDPAAAIELCQRLGRTDELMHTQPTADRAFVASEGGIHPVPRGFSLMLPNDVDAVLNSPLLDAAAKRRFMAERDVVASRWEQDESLESFAIRRFGNTFYERLIQPLASGIYTADPATLSMQATMARFVDLEKKHGSLIRAAEVRNSSSGSSSVERQASGARYGLFRAPRQGIGQLIQWLTDALVKTEFRMNRTVQTIAKTEKDIPADSMTRNTWTIQALAKQNGELETLTVDGVVLAGSARSSAAVLAGLDGPLSRLLGSIESTSVAIVQLGLDCSGWQKPFAGYGIIVPAVLNRQVIATSFASNKFAGRAPLGKVLVRFFIGGALQHALVDETDARLVEIATAELARTVGLTNAPEWSRVVRWRNSMPQYRLGHLDRVDGIESLAAKHGGLALAGNSYRGVGIPACIQSGVEAADRLAKYLEIQL